MSRHTLLLTVLAWVLFSSCAFTNSEKEVYYPQGTPLGTLKESYAALLAEAEKYQLTERRYMLSQNREEILNSLKVNDEIEIEGTNLRMIFYSFNVGSDIIREAEVFSEREGKWLMAGYFSSYEDDPFGNGKGNEGKKLLEKADSWEESNDLIDWY